MNYLGLVQGGVQTTIITGRLDYIEYGGIKLKQVNLTDRPFLTDWLGWLTDWLTDWVKNFTWFNRHSKARFFELTTLLALLTDAQRSFWTHILWGNYLGLNIIVYPMHMSVWPRFRVNSSVFYDYTFLQES